MTAALAYLRKNWRPLAVLAAILLAYLGGRYGHPARVVERRTVEWRDRVKWRDRVVKETVAGPVRTRTIVKEYPAPPADAPCADRPARVVETVEERGHVVTLERRDAEGLVVSEGKAAAERVVDSRARWRVGAMVGAQVALPPALVVGLHGEARVAGPVWAGAWVLADPRWPTGRVDAGVSVGVEW